MVTNKIQWQKLWCASNQLPQAITYVGLTLVLLLVFCGLALAQSRHLNVDSLQISSKGAALAQLTWENNLERTLQLAKKTNKMILVDVYTDWCGWCKRLDRSTYQDPQVVAFVNNQFVCLKLNAEDGGTGQDFARRHQVTGYPCIMVLDTEGKVRGTFYGYRAPPQFIDSVKNSLPPGLRR